MTNLRLSLSIACALLFFLLLNVSPFLTWIPQFPYDMRRMMELIMLGLGVLWLVLDTRLRTAWLQCYQTLPSLARMALLVFFGLGLISAVQAVFPRLSLMEVGMYGLLLIAAITFATLHREYQQRFNQTVLVGLAIGTGFYGVHLLLNGVSYWIFNVQHTQGYEIQQAFLTSPGFQNVRFLMSFISITLPLVVLPSLYYAAHSRWRQTLFLSISSLWWYAMIINHGRTLWLEWAVLLVFMPLFFKAQCWPWLKQHLKSALAGGALYLILNQLNALILYFSKTQPSSFQPVFHTDEIRIQLWGEALRYMQQHPWLGIGPLDFALGPKKIALAHPHNVLLLIGSEWGIPALVMLLALLGWGVVRWLQLKPLFTAHTDPHRRLLYIALTGAFIGGSIDSLLNGTLVMPLSQIAMVLLVGWMVGFYQSAAADIRTALPITWRAHSLLLLLLGITTLLVAYGVFPLVFQLIPMSTGYYQDVCAPDPSNCIWVPRFWVQGWLQFYVPYL